MNKREWRQWRCSARVDPALVDPNIPGPCHCRGCSDRVNTHGDALCRACHASGCDARLDECYVHGSVTYAGDNESGC